MSLRAIKYLFAFVLVILSQAGFSQSFDDVELQKLLIENPSLLENFEQKKENNSTSEIDRSLTSKKQDIVTRNEALAIDLTVTDNQKESHVNSLSQKYFTTLTGENLSIFGSNEFNRIEDDNIILYSAKTGEGREKLLAKISKN